MVKEFYLHRAIEKEIVRTNNTFKVLYLGGPRQVGKTTVLQHIAKQLTMNYITLDDMDARKLAKEDPKLFLEKYPSPLLIDEVQYAPELFPAIKMRVDQSQDYGQYWLTGSQHFSMIRGMQESLAGRVGILSLSGVSYAETYPEYVTSIAKKNKYPFPPLQIPTKKTPTISEVFQYIFTGGFPSLWHPTHAPDRESFYRSYIQTYIERDLSSLFHVSKLSEFHTFLRLCAERTGQVLNLSSLARDASISPHAAKEWLSILEQTGLVYLLQPYFSNRSLRVIKSPKLYCVDTGLASYITGFSSSEVLLHDSRSGAFFETCIISEILKSFWNRGLEPRIYYYRDKQGREVDLLIERNGKLHAAEIKQSKNVERIQREGLKYVEYLRKKIPHMDVSYVIALIDSWYYCNEEKDLIIPFTAIQ